MNTEDLIKEAKARFHVNYQKIQLTEKYKGKLIFADQQGLWKADDKLFALLACLTNDEIILLDLYNNPVKVNRAILLEKAKSIYTETMLEWYSEFESLKNNR